MPIEVMKVKGTQRAFYRIYIIPLHLGKKDEESNAALKKELAKHKKYVKDNNLQAELDKYLAAQKDRQEKYNVMQALKGEFAAMKGKGFDQNIKELAAKEEEMEDAIAEFLVAKEQFKAKYH